jgi:hypothetical protein
MSLEEIRLGAERAWDRFYSWRNVWARSRVVESIRARIAFVLISKLYRQMYANTGIAADSARVQRSAQRARWIGYACRRLFLGKPMPDLQVPGKQLGLSEGINEADADALFNTGWHTTERTVERQAADGCGNAVARELKTSKRPVIDR